MNSTTIDLTEWVLGGLLFVSGIICTFLYRENLRSFFEWIRPSWEEEKGRASGKALAAFVFSITLCTITHRILTRGPSEPDFKPNQTHLIEIVISTLEYLILGLFFTKILSKGNLLGTFLSRFSKNGDNGNGNNGNPPAATPKPTTITPSPEPPIPGGGGAPVPGPDPTTTPIEPLPKPIVE